MKRSSTDIWRPYLDHDTDSKYKLKRVKIVYEDKEVSRINRPSSFMRYGITDGESRLFTSDLHRPPDNLFRPINYPASETSSMNSSSCSARTLSPTFDVSLSDRSSPASSCTSNESHSSSLENSSSSLHTESKDYTSEESTRQRRTKFSKIQLDELSRVFYSKTYLTLQERHDLAKKLNLKESQIRNWFQNKRMKAKRDYIVAIDKGLLLPVENPGLPRFSRLPENYFLSYPMYPKY